MKNIYIPVENIYDYACYSVQDMNTIRAYVSTPRANSTSNYTDFYINSHYLQKSGSQTWGTTTTLPVCVSMSTITNDVYYRTDFADTMIIFIILSYFCFFLPFKFFSRIFGRWFRL